MTRSTPPASGDKGLRPRDALLLGRVSNLPTVWSNVLAAAAVAASAVPSSRATPLSEGVLALVLLAMSLMYVGGMYLNDAFDAAIDAEERPERPIPAGRVARRTVFVAGYAMLGSAIVLLFVLGWPAGILALALALVIVAYDVHHKGFPLSPVVMGLARWLVYLCAASAFTGVITLNKVGLAGGVLFSWIIGLTYVAKQETLGVVRHAWPLIFLFAPAAYGLTHAIDQPRTWVPTFALVLWIGVALRFLIRRAPGDVPRAVVSLIAGVALVDAVAATAAGAPALAMVCGGCFLLTLLLQRVIPGT